MALDSLDPAFSDRLAQRTCSAFSHLNTSSTALGFVNTVHKRSSFFRSPLRRILETFPDHRLPIHTQEAKGNRNSALSTTKDPWRRTWLCPH